MNKSADRLPTMSAVESLVIELLGNRDRYGLELVEASGRKLKRGTVYVTLTRMESKGFIESWQEEPRAGAIGLPRRMYRVTTYGLKVHRAYSLLREALAMRPARVN
jgi:DNA-binding PadR family transcriptional regulator